LGSLDDRNCLTEADWTKTLLLASRKDVARSRARRMVPVGTAVRRTSAEEIGLPKNRCILSAKVSAVSGFDRGLPDAGERSDYAIPLSPLSELGMGSKGIVASAAALAFLLAGWQCRRTPSGFSLPEPA